MAKTAIFSWNFDLFLTFFIDCGHIYNPNGVIWGSTSRPHIGDLVMSLFLLWGPPFMTGDGPNMAGLSTFQSGPKGSERDQNGQPKCFRPFRTLLGPSGLFWTIENKDKLFAPEHLCQTLLWTISDKNDLFAPNGQRVPDGPKRVPR